MKDGTREESPEPTRISTATPTTTITPREVTPPQVTPMEVGNRWSLPGEDDYRPTLVTPLQNPSGIIGGLLTRFLANQSKPTLGHSMPSVRKILHE